MSRVRFPRVPILLLAMIGLSAETGAPKPLTGQTAIIFFAEAQDVPAFTPDELAARARTLGDEPEAIAADAALNQWKQCVQEALVHWAPLPQGPGTLIDGAFGRCADTERDYRAHLIRMTPGGRQVIDVQLARGMTRTLEEGWRPRLTATVLDQQLAKQPTTLTAASPTTREFSARLREERVTPRD